MKIKTIFDGALMFLFVLMCLMFPGIMFGQVMGTNMGGNLIATSKRVQGKYPLCAVSDIINREYEYYIVGSYGASFEGLCFIDESEKDLIESRMLSIKDEGVKSEDGHVFPVAMRYEKPFIKNFITRYFIRGYSSELCFSYSLTDRSTYKNGNLIPFNGKISVFKMNDGRYLLSVNCAN